VPEHAGSWLVSSAHRKMREEGGVRQWGPYFERHARQLGSITTACGLLASNWHVFHDVEFRADDLGACRDCVEVVNRLLLKRSNHSTIAV